MFQSTPPRGGRRSPIRACRLQCCCFNPRPRAGGDSITKLSWPAYESVSIHAPARGATFSFRRTCTVLILVSIHAPARGATYTLRTKALRECGFQSTPPRGGRQRYGLMDINTMPVSIHAPARGATTPEAHVSARRS